MMDSLPSNDENNRNPLPLDGGGRACLPVGRGGGGQEKFRLPLTFTLLDKTSSIPTSDICIFLSNRVNPLPLRGEENFGDIPRSFSRLLIPNANLDN